MTSQEQAKALLKDLSLIEADEIIDTQEKMKATQVCRIVEALAAAQRETWEAAATLMESKADICTCGRRLAKVLRSKIKEVRP